MRSRPIHLPFAAAVVSAACLVACSTPGNYHNDASHEKLLQTLRQCLVEIPIRGEKNKEFVSPCITMDVSPLNGIAQPFDLDLGRRNSVPARTRRAVAFQQPKTVPLSRILSGASTAMSTPHLAVGQNSFVRPTVTCIA
jgi:hypothetical protein